jgi:rare lipoprotein A (peptidoglycan hydrolase)
MEENKKDEKHIKILKKKGKPGTDYALISALVGVGLVVLIVGGISFGEAYAKWRKTHEWQFPIQWVGFVKNIEQPKEEVIEIIEEQVIESKPTWAGLASWYGATPETCLGCNENFIMANGEKLDDRIRTIAFNEVVLGTKVIVTNTDNGLSEIVEVTDTGGFEKYGKIADLSKALKESLQCADTCNVMIEIY